jgi:DNA-binding transcriptional MerR regulator
MRMSQLVAESGVPLATIKYYLREGLLAPGEATSARQADYDDSHVHRLRVIRALTNVAGLSLQQTRAVLGIIERPDAPLFDALGQAIAALPPHPEPADDYPRARAVIAQLGQVYDPRYAAVAQLERALGAAEQAGLPVTAERVAVYGEHIHAMAEYDLARMPLSSEGSAIEYAVLGTALYEPVLVALRRLAHQDVAAGMLDGAV